IFPALRKARENASEIFIFKNKAIMPDAKREFTSRAGTAHLAENPQVFRYSAQKPRPCGQGFREKEKREK
ncbi:MAG TPA: hypothetical protein VN369_07705, partial [Terriglobales bacterium]|nr:hypothetical protein [Terriglobales bacterium]